MLCRVHGHPGSDRDSQAVTHSPSMGLSLVEGLQLKQCQLGLLPCRVQPAAPLCWAGPGDSGAHEHSCGFTASTSLTRGPRDCRSSHRELAASAIQIHPGEGEMHSWKVGSAPNTLLLLFWQFVSHEGCTEGRGTLHGNSENLGLFGKISASADLLKTHQPPVGHSL